jgi:hypothetical protein
VKYHLRYWWLWLCHTARKPFSRWARHAVPLELVIAEWERDPMRRKSMAEARERMRAASGANAAP